MSAWPDLRPIGMTVVPTTGVQPGNVLVLSDRLGLPELAAAMGFRPYRGLHVIRRGVADPTYAAAVATVGAAVSYLLPDLPFRALDPLPLTCQGPGGIAQAAAAVDAALGAAPAVEAPSPARADAEATRIFEELPLARPGAMLAEACAFAGADPFAMASLRTDEAGAFAFLLSPAHALVGRHWPDGVEMRVCGTGGPAQEAYGLLKGTAGRATTFVVSGPGWEAPYASRILATRRLREALAAASGRDPGPVRRA